MTSAQGVLVLFSHRVEHSLDFDRTLCVINVLNIERKLCGEILKCRTAFGIQWKCSPKKRKILTFAKCGLVTDFPSLGTLKQIIKR